MSKFLNKQEIDIEDCLIDKIRKLNPTKSHLVETLGIEFTKVYKDSVEAKMLVCEKVLQPFGILHGGALVALAESLASLAGWLNVDETKYRVVGAEINANHIRSTKDGYVYGKANPINLGRKIHVWEIKIFNENQKIVSISRCTLMVVAKEHFA